MNPKSTRDFELLYNELEAWVQKEVKEMNSTQLSDIERKEKMAGILAKQTKALQTIDKLKVEASKLGKEKRVARMLDLMAKPKLWEMGTGEVQEVHTQFTVRAAELMDLYKVLIDYRVSLDERLDILLVPRQNPVTRPPLGMRWISLHFGGRFRIFLLSIPIIYFLIYIHTFHYLNQLFNDGNSARAVSR